jgi:flagellar hook-associated protein 1 FlgK
MPSQFFGLEIGASALSSFQTAINTTANNAANVQTTGYTRQTANLAAKESLRVYQRYGTCGSGVEVTSITQERNLYYDEKYWTNNSSKGYFEQKLYSIDQIQTVFKDDENSQKGFSTIFANMFAALDTLKTRGEEEEVRNQFINQAQGLCTYFNQLSQSLLDIQEDCNAEIKTTVEQINSMSAKIAVLNKQINQIEVRGENANDLRDKRANLIDELSELVNVETKEFDVTNSNGQNLGGTNYRVYINGQILVDGNEYRTLECTSGEYKLNQMDADGLYNITWSDTKMDFQATGGSAGGSLKALFDVRDGNNMDNLKGVVTDATSGDIIDKNDNNKVIGTGVASITISTNNVELSSLSIAEKGRITVNNRHYYYTGWTADVETDENGNDYVTSVKFIMEPEENKVSGADYVTSIAKSGNTVTCGETVDSLGVPYYQAQINEFLRNFTEAFNTLEKGGETLDGEIMGSFFTAQDEVLASDEDDMSDWYTKLEAAEKKQKAEKDAGNNDARCVTEINSTDDTYYKLTASTIKVNAVSLKDPNYFATYKKTDPDEGVANYNLTEDLLTLQKKSNMFRGNDAESFLETLLSDVTIDVNKVEISSNNYSNIATVISTQRTSVSGVDEDEEALNLIKYQNAYNLASKVISVMAEMYDKLIEETGVT